MNAHTEQFQRDLSRFPYARRGGNGEYRAHCPVSTHGKGRGDLNASLSIRESFDTGEPKTVYKCHAGCTQEDILLAINALPLGPGPISNQPSISRAEAIPWPDYLDARIVATYDYGSGKLSYQNVRLTPTKEQLAKGQTKDFRIRRRGVNGEWLLGRGDIPATIFGLSELQASNSKQVIVCEGEEDVLALRALGFVAVTAGSADSWQDEFANHFAGRVVVLSPDNDKAGTRLVCDVTASVPGKAALLKVITLPASKDPREWCQNGGTREALLGIIEAAMEYQPPKSCSGIETKITCTAASEITVRPLRWLWKDRIPLGKVTLFCGDPDVGKSLTIIDVVSRYSTGRPWPDCENNLLPASVAMLCAEDEWEDTVVPRLIGAGADLTKILRVDPIQVEFKGKKLERSIALDTDIDAIEKMLRAKPEIGLVTFDPLASYLGDKNRNVEREIRRVLDTVKELASRTNVTILVADHFNKTTLASAIHRVSGSTSVVGAPRAVWGFIKDPDNHDERIMTRIKCNVTKNHSGLRYALGEKVVTISNHAISIPYIVWRGATETTADEAFSRNSNPEEAKISKAVRWLKQFLADGRKLAAEVYGAAEEQGFDSKFLLRTIRARAGVKNPYQEGGRGRWFWELNASEDKADLRNQIPVSSDIGVF